MRKFFSYRPCNPEYHYHAPRKELLDSIYTYLIGDIRRGRPLFYGLGAEANGKVMAPEYGSVSVA